LDLCRLLPFFSMLVTFGTARAPCGCTKRCEKMTASTGVRMPHPSRRLGASKSLQLWRRHAIELVYIRSSHWERCWSLDVKKKGWPTGGEEIPSEMKSSSSCFFFSFVLLLGDRAGPLFGMLFLRLINRLWLFCCKRKILFHGW
jgi:hypothetical protein